MFRRDQAEIGHQLPGIGETGEIAGKPGAILDQGHAVGRAAIAFTGRT
jgi:hypothetical protein